MLNCFTRSSEEKTIPITIVEENQFKNWSAQQPERVQNCLKATDFTAKNGSTYLLCNAEGNLERIIMGRKDKLDWFLIGQLAATLPKGVYFLDHHLDDEQSYAAALAWGLGSYQFGVYKKLPPLQAKLQLSDKLAEHKYLEAILRASFLVRDLINTPTDNMYPADLAEVASELAQEFGASMTQIVGEELLNEGYPSIHTVGRGSEHAPRLIDFKWGNPDHPKVTLVGKGVCFDSGGLNIKPTNGMGTMKKDMAGAAHVLGLALVVMAMKLPVRLRVLIPAVENAISGNAYHPGDVIITRKGISVEINNTDAEGRVILSDALTEASTENPEVLFDFASLTGAARVALGTDISALFSNSDTLANELERCAQQEQDPVWRLPLFQPYKKLLDSKVADLSNCSSSGWGGAITAALFLQDFVGKDLNWAHFDIMAWNERACAIGPEGGEAMALRAVARYLCKRYGG